MELFDFYPRFFALFDKYEIKLYSIIILAHTTIVLRGNMKKLASGILVLGGILLSLTNVTAMSIVDGRSFHAEQPLIITSCGQSPDSFMVSAEARKLGIDHIYDDLIGADKLGECRTLLVVMGGSSKGLGEAGLTAPMELERVTSILDKARKLGIKVIGIHVGGSKRRGKMSEDFVQLVARRADCLVVSEDGNSDNYFTKEARNHKVPLYLLKSAGELKTALKSIFSIN